MLYNKQEFPQYVRTAGKITVVTAVSGLLVFVMAFIFDFGAQEISKASAQSATTTLTVLNTPPQFVVNAYEVIESSTSSPTNSGDQVQWAAIAEDSNGAPYFLLLCSTNASPTAKEAANSFSLGTAPPECGAGAIQWAVSPATPSGDMATAATTTTENFPPFAEVNDWFAWVCDDDPVSARCNNIPVQGYSATNSSPFHVNRRPVFSNFYNNGPADPGGVITFFSTSTDPDVVGGDDELFLIVCGEPGDYNSTTRTCNTRFIASTTIGVLEHATAVFNLPAVIRDQLYGAYGFIIDQHGHQAIDNPRNADFEVNNVAPVVQGGDIELYGDLGPGSDLRLSVPGGESPGNTLNFTISDANSCLTAASSSEIVNYSVALFRSSYGTTTCDGSAGAYDPNYCYTNGVDNTVWNLDCAPTTTCDSPFQDSMSYSCTFPLWYLADPTDSSSPYVADNWTVGIAGIDNDNATGTVATTTNPRQLISFAAIGIEDAAIAYGAIEPGDNTGTLSATSTALNIGNTGIDHEITGESMCGTFAVGNDCPTSATSTIAEHFQQFASTSIAFDASAYTGLPPFTTTVPGLYLLSSTTVAELAINIPKTIATSTPQDGTTHWGIAVPGTITLAGSYQGLNTITAVISDASAW
jgi:hypothetical protein